MLQDHDATPDAPAPGATSRAGRTTVPAGYLLDDDPARLDRETIWSFLSTKAYWGRWRNRDDVDAQVRGAWRVVGAYRERDGRRDDGAMVGFARAVSDGVALAYLADVFVLPAHRGQGLGRALVTMMVDVGPGADFRWLLHTADAHGLYAGLGFAVPDATLLERPRRGRPLTRGDDPCASN